MYTLKCNHMEERKGHSSQVGIKLISACQFPFICGMVFALNQSNPTRIGLRSSGKIFKSGSFTSTLGFSK